MDNPTPRLSKRETEIVRLAVVDGLTNAEIAQRLGLAHVTIQNHFARVHRRWGSGNRFDLSVLAILRGVVTLEEVATATAERMQRRREQRAASD